MPRTRDDGLDGLNRDAARRRMVDGARRHFFAHGFRRVTMDDLAGELGMSKKTLYACFPSKMDLLREAIQLKLEEVDAGFASITANPSDHFLADLHAFLACIRHHSEEIKPDFVRDMERESPELFALIQNRREEMIRLHFKKLIAHGRSEGIVRKDISVTLIIEILLGAMEAILNPRKMVQLNLTPKTAFAAIIRIVLEGVIVRNGRADK